ncbi:MAG: bacillithiol biosynthesis deacetylase BshB1 [Chlorobi bacterium]|nr:bacillithiol biosynthesis deacetylase BshB1 [Chlorobiota bacterium]MCI0717297.1 bacillithiol biosynthesis deacetylase BshB1 [Chlorobiota bacterium]
MKLDAIFFAAHPDDAELCSGGTIIKLVKSGKKIGLVDLTQGELSTRGTSAARKKEAERANKSLGISVRENLKIPDGNIDNNEKNRLKVIKVIRKYKPEIIFFPYFHDRHPDHHHTHMLVKSAAFYSGLVKIKTEKLAPHRPKRNYYYMQSFVFEPNLIVDITDTFNDKMKSIECYQSQFYNPKSKSPQTYISEKKFKGFIEARAVFYGFQIGVKYGEPFYTEEKIRINPKALFEI